MKDQQGFTLIEMMIVLLIISVLLIITIPNIATHSSNIDKKGCEAYMKMVESQIQAYKIDKHKIPTLQELQTDGYLKSAEGACPDGTTIQIEADGEVAKSPTP